ncbi:MAG: peptide transporter substrate-binding protein, partial [Thermomicrobiales bacterium]|nr:peptide transporter substrate-binding protein [Thermomicrobiales bacterium]
PYPGILPILASPSLGILDSALVSENGGTDAADAAETDTAEEFLNSQSAGSGPYMTTSYLPDQEVVLERNPNYWREPGAFDRIVIRNITEAATQKLQIEAGDIDIATGLSQDQVPTMEGSEGVTVNSSAAATTFYVLMNNNPDVGGAFSNPLIQQAGAQVRRNSGDRRTRSDAPGRDHPDGLPRRARSCRGDGDGSRAGTQPC